jgi:DNA-binding beta-propeller fold protein YncE
LWAANTGESTVSKIDTVTIEEVGRYKTHWEWGSPSRTSVGLGADVAVGNRTGSVVKVYAELEDCVDTNGVPGIQTSSGKDDVLEWGQDDCVAWIAQAPRNMLRPVQWSPGTQDEASCQYLDQNVWTVAANAGHNGSVLVIVLDGETGESLHEVPIPELQIGYYGPYGAAFDTEGDFWFVDSGNDGPAQELVRVRGDDLSYDVWKTPDGYHPYGFTVDSHGRPWMAGWIGGILRFDPDTETFAVNPDYNGIGMQDDGNGHMWVVHYPYSLSAAISFDLETLEVDKIIEDSRFGSGRGLSFDVDGDFWVVGTSTAVQVDPETGHMDVYDGLDGAYTYSDMTGWALANVTDPPEG